MNNAVDKYVRGVNNWANGLNLIQIVVLIIIAAILVKITGPLVSAITKHIVDMSAKARKRAGVRQTSLKKAEDRKRASTIANLIAFIIKVIIIICAAASILSEFGIDLGPILASAGIAGAAVALAAQSLLKDMIAGITIILENQYRVGDVVQLSGTGFPTNTPVEGTVQEITLRRTVLRDKDGNVHSVANGSIVEVINRTVGYSKFHFDFTVPNDTDLEELKEKINAIGQAMREDDEWHKKIVDPPRFVEVADITSSGINVIVGGTTVPGAQWKVSAEFRARLVEPIHELTEKAEKALDRQN